MTAIMNNPRERTRFMRFAAVGFFGAIVDFGVMNLLVRLFHFPLIAAGTISFIAAIMSNFTWNRFWTYPDSRSKSPIHQLLTFSLVSVIGLAIRVPLLAVLEPILERLFNTLPFQIPFLDPNFLADNLTLAIAVIIVMFWNFFANRYWTYNDIE